MPIGPSGSSGTPSGTAGGDLTGTYPNPSVGTAWTAFTPSTTGITGESVALAVYKQVGNIVYLMLSTSGTGSTTARTFTLPVSTGANGGQWLGLIQFVKDAGTATTTPGAVNLANSSTTATLFKTTAQAAGSWTGSGAWQIALAMFYGTN